MQFNPIIRDLGSVDITSSRNDIPSESSASFSETLAKAFESAGEAERSADTQLRSFTLGKAGIHETVMAQERAALMLRYVVTMKNRAVEAYRELMNTQI